MEELGDEAIVGKVSETKTVSINEEVLVQLRLPRVFMATDIDLVEGFSCLGDLTVIHDIGFLEWMLRWYPIVSLSCR
jgi:hypothetical protein